MTLKHKSVKKIAIKNPRFRALRNSLREILYLEWDRRSRAVIAARSRLLDSELSHSMKLELHRELSMELENLKKAIVSSIIVCGWCHHRDKDAIYNPSNHQWFCPKCYDDHTQEILISRSYIY